MELTSTAFKTGEGIPERYALGGKNVSPPLEWSNIPVGTKEFAILCEDIDASAARPFVHWIVYGISSSISALPEGIPKEEIIMLPVHLKQGVNSFGEVGYDGPRPPVGDRAHRYIFTVYALKSESGLAFRATREEFDRILEGRMLAKASIVGLHQRKRSAA